MAQSPFASLQYTVRYVEWAVLLASLLSGLLSTYFREKPDLLLAFCTYVAVFFLLSGCFPVDRPLWQRRLYTGIEILLILSALALRLGFDILMYFVLAKSCLLLPRREVILAAIVLGVGFSAINAWVLPERITELVEHIQAGLPVYNVQSILLVNAIGYVGSSLFAICFGFVLASERRSRQRAEALSQQVEAQAATLERARIAREIHDLLGHTLTALDVQLELADRLYQRDHSGAYRALTIARQLSSQCFQDVRRSVQTMRQKEFNLTQSITALAEQMQQLHPIRIQVDVKLPQLPVQISHQLYCIVQEGLTNVQKHAQATVVRLLAYATSTEIFLELDDNGQGFNPNETAAGFGLQGMQERIQLLNGHLTIASTEGQGTYLRVRIPQ